MKRTIRTENGRVVGIGIRRADPQATKRVVNDLMQTDPIGHAYREAVAAMQAIPPCKCDRLTRRADPVDAVRWVRDVESAKATLTAAAQAHAARRAELYAENLQYFPLREGEAESDDVESFAAKFATLTPYQKLLATGAVVDDPVALEHHKDQEAQQRRAALLAEYLESKIAELEAVGNAERGE